MNDEDKIYIDGEFNDHYHAKQRNKKLKPKKVESVTPSPSCSHKTRELPYVAWHEWAEDMNSKGIRQTQCPVCKLWLFPEEL